MPNDANKNTEIKKLKKIADYLQSKEDMVEIELYTNERYEVEEYYVVTIGENYVGINRTGFYDTSYWSLELDSETFSKAIFEAIEKDNYEYLVEDYIMEEGDYTEAKFIGGGEESYGYLSGDFIRDKDAVMSCALIAEMVAWAKSSGKTLFNLMEDMYMEHGFYLEDLISITKHGRSGQEEISEKMSNLRKNPPKTIAGEEVSKVIDYLESEKTGLPKSNVLQFITNKGTKVTARPSGTEPKIKYYFSVQEHLSSKSEYLSTKEKLTKKIVKIQTEMNILQ